MKINYENIALVDENDNTIGSIDKIEAHEKGLLHRAFSVFVFNTQGEILIQQRAASKYHSPLLWSNTCCSHPAFGEDLTLAVKRRMMEEMGMSVEPEFLFSFIYKTKFDNGLTEHELDHVFYVVTDEAPQPNEEEVNNWKYISIGELESQLYNQPELFTYWLKECFNQVKQSYIP